MTEKKSRVIIIGLLDFAWELGVLIASKTDADRTQRDRSLRVLSLVCSSLFSLAWRCNYSWTL